MVLSKAEQVRRLVEKIPVGTAFTAKDIADSFGAYGPSSYMVAHFLYQMETVEVDTAHGGQNRPSVYRRRA
mgnify:CR=1 FL=1